MLDNLGSFLNVASTVLVLASLTGLGLMRGTVTNLRENLRDARDEIADKDRRLATVEADAAKERAQRAEETAQLRAQNATQQSEIETLRRTVTGEPHWSEISSKLDAHSGEARLHWGTVEELLRELLKHLTDFLKRGQT